MPGIGKTYRRGRRAVGPGAVRRGLVAALALLFLTASVHVVGYMIRSADTRREEARMRAEIGQAQEAPKAAPMPAEAGSTASSEAAARPVDLQALFASPLRRNPDTAGALEAGSDIKTWVVQRNDNTYYLTHSFEGKKNSAGAVFLDACCALKPASRNLTLYGHNMIDGTAFSKLRDFRHEDYLNVFPVIRFATRYEDARYAIFAVFDFSVDENSPSYFDPARFDFATEGEFLVFADLARSRSLLPSPVSVEARDSLITLVTCDESDRNTRFAVMARKLRQGESPEDFASPVDGAIRELRYKKGTSYMKGPDVLRLQEALSALGYFQEVCDGTFGPGTAEAVRAFQRDHLLTPDGIAGTETIESIQQRALGDTPPQ
jgi:sortase B